MFLLFVSTSDVEQTGLDLDERCFLIDSRSINISVMQGSHASLKVLEGT